MKSHLEKINFVRNNNIRKSHNRELNLYFYNNRDLSTGQAFLVPNIVEFMHDVTENGNIGAIKKKIMQLTPLDIIRLMWWNKFNVRNILRKDFSSGIMILIEIEVLKILKSKPLYIVLSDYITDLALALDNKDIYYNFSWLMKRLGKENIFFTNNLPLFIDKCIEWKVEFELVFFPMNKSGYEMNPDKSTVEEYVRRIPSDKVIAVVTSEEASQRTYLNKFGIKRILENWFI